MTEPGTPSTNAWSRLLHRRRLTRFLRLYGIALLVSAALLALGDIIRVMHGAGPHLRAHASQFVFYDGLRKIAPLANAVALVLALVLWGARQRPKRLSRRRDRVLRQALVVALPAYATAGAVAIVVGLAVLIGSFGQPLSIVSLGAGIVTSRDFWIGGQSTVVDSLLVLAVAGLYPARWSSLRLALPLKLLGALSMAIAVHFALASFIE